MLDLPYLAGSYQIKMFPRREHAPLPRSLAPYYNLSILTLSSLSLTFSKLPAVQTIPTLSKFSTDRNSPGNTHILDDARGVYVAGETRGKKLNHFLGQSHGTAGSVASYAITFDSSSK